MTSKDQVVERILSTDSTITVVGGRTNPGQVAHRIPAHRPRRGWRIVPVNPRGAAIADEPAGPARVIAAADESGAER